MGTLDIFTNAPGMLRVESLNITVRFERTGPYTGRVSWNIPTPAAGCTADNQAYCGMLVTVNTVAQTIDMAPVNGSVYKSDPTVDPNLFAGDTIQGAQVVGAFYNDRTTTMFDITGLLPNTPYYVTAYPVDCVLRYFREGISAYSLNYTTGHGTTGEPGYQVIWTNPSNTIPNPIVELGDPNFVQPPPPGVLPSDPTCLGPNVMYEFGLHLTGEGFDNKYTININGLNGMLWGDLVNEINKQFLLIDNPPQGPFPPNAGGLYYNQSTNQLFQWDGYVNVQLPVLVSDTPPNQVDIGDYWFNTTNNTLYIWNGASWDVVTVLSYATDPTQPICDQSFWFNGTQGYLWNGTTWCTVPTLISDVDPSLPPSDLCDTYWFEPLTHQFFRYNDSTLTWDLILPVEYITDPNMLPMGSYWFDSTNNILLQLDTPNPGWNEVFVRIDETEPTNPAPGVLWYNPTTQELKQWDNINTEWDDVNSITYPTDPSIIESCGYWYETDTNILWIWDIVNSVWVEVGTLFEQEIDPSLPPVILDGSVWFDPITGKFYKWKGTACDPSWEEVEFLFLPTNPLTPSVGVVWHDTTNDVWYVWNGVVWVAIDPLFSPTDPTMLPAGTYWYNPTNLGLSYWNGIVWISVMYSTVPLSPSVGTVWFNTTTEQLLTWNGVSWQNTLAKATAELDINGNLLLSTTERSSLAMISVYDTGTLFPNLCVDVNILPMVCGADGVSDLPSYDELGVGTDGSLDQRLDIANEIRYNLGYPIVDVELSKEQLDICITQAIREIRQKTAIGYKHGFFFMNVKNGEQNYILSNKNNGMNKIVNIMGIYRLTSAFISSAHGAGVYGQIVLQHLYNMGNFDLLSYHIISEYVHLMEILFAARLTFTWDEQTRTVFIFHKFSFPELVAIEASIERTEQDIMTDRWVKPWVIKFATARAMSMLAEVRGKFSTLPSANGGVTLNAQDLRSRAKEIYDECALEIENYQADKPEDFGMGSQFTFG